MYVYIYIYMYIHIYSIKQVTSYIQVFVAEAERVWVTKHGAMILKRPRSKEEGAAGVGGGGGEGGGGRGRGGWDVVSEHAEYY
jgi:uncharacterized membrane protein YgcG